jgi:hypothetical protein
VWNSAKEDFTTAAGWKRVGWNFGTSLVLGGLLKAALPEGGIATKVAGAGLGLVFGGMAVKPVYKSYENAQNATTMTQLHAAGQELGDIGGDFTTNMVIGGAGYFAGAGIANGVLETEAMDGFAAKKARFWEPKEKWMADSAPRLSKYLLTPEAIQRARTVDMNTRSWEFAGNKARLLDSMKEQAPGEKVGAIDPNESFNVSIYAKSVDDTGIKLDRRLARIARGKASFVTDDEMTTKYGANTDSMSAI